MIEEFNYPITTKTNMARDLILVNNLKLQKILSLIIALIILLTESSLKILGHITGLIQLLYCH